MNSLKHKILPILAFVLFAGFIQAQNLDEIIDKHLKAHGDISKWDATKALAIKGVFSSFSVEHPIYLIKTIEGDYYSDQHIGHQPVEIAFKDGKGWTIDPWHEFSYPRLNNKFENIMYHQLADYFTPFYKYKEKGYTAELLGQKDEDGVDTYEIKLTRANGEAETWYLDANTYLEYKVVSNWVDFATPIQADTYFDDFQTVEGVVIPFFVEHMFGQRDYTLKVESVEFNPEYDVAIFEMPKSDEMNKLALMEGEWKVNVEMKGRNGEFMTIDNSISNIAFTSHNNLHQELSYENYYVQPMDMHYSYHKTKGKYILTIYTDFSSTTDLFEGEFKEGVLTFNEIVAEDSETGPSFQLILSDLSKEGFIIEMKQTRDKGASWDTAVKFSFSK